VTPPSGANGVTSLPVYRKNRQIAYNSETVRDGTKVTINH